MKKTQLKPSSRKAIQYRGVECLNCGHPLDLSDRYCAYCGQLNTTKRLSLGDFFNEFILSVITYDSRFRFTVKDLLFKPGTITRNYVEGRRLKYANPFRFFLSASIFYFILLAIISLFEEPTNVNFDNGSISIDKDKLSKDNLKDVSKDINLKELQNLNEASADSLEQKINARINAGIASIDIKKKEEEKSYTYISEDSINRAERNSLNRLVKKSIFFYEFYEVTDITSPARALDSLKYEKNRTNMLLYSKVNNFKRIKENPTRFIKYLASKTPFFLFFFAPLFAFFFWMIYSKKKFNYMEHLVFIFHIFSWVFVVLILCLLPDMFLGDNYIAAIVLLLIGPFYFYKALRNFYKQKRRWTIPKFVFLNIVFYIGATLFALIFFAITAFLF